MTRFPPRLLVFIILLFVLYPVLSETGRTQKRAASVLQSHSGKGKVAARSQKKKGQPKKSENGSSSLKKGVPPKTAASPRSTSKSAKGNKGSAARQSGRNAVKQTAKVSSRKRVVTKEGASGEKPITQSNAIRLKQGELEKIQQDIRTYEARLAESRKAERNTLERLDLYDRQTSLIRKVVSHLSAEIADNKQGIEAAKTHLRTEEERLAHVKRTYARYLVSAYKRGKSHDSELLLTSTSLNQMFIRSKYLKAFTGRQKSEAEEIRQRQERVQAQKTALETQVMKQKSTVSAKQNEEQTLKRKSVEHKELLDQVRKDKSEYQAELKRKQAAAAKIERFIADLIERERIRHREEGRSRGNSSTGTANTGVHSRGDIAELPGKPISQTAFGRLKGRLPWPLAKGRLATGFGDQVNPKLGTVIPSNGIDIETSPGDAVRVVADGVVSLVSFIAGYGNLLIVFHDDGFRTVYARLSSIAVKEGQRVKAGQAIARSAVNATGTQVHFEVWRERNKQNPLSWLAKR